MLKIWFEINRVVKPYRNGSIKPEVTFAQKSAVSWETTFQAVPRDHNSPMQLQLLPRPLSELPAPACWLSTRQHGCVRGGHGRRLHRRCVCAPVPGNHQAHRHGVDQRSEDQHPVHRGGMRQDPAQHARAQHAPGQVAPDQGKRDSLGMSTLAVWECPLPVTQQGDPQRVTTNSSQLLFLRCLANA